MSLAKLKRKKYIIFLSFSQEWFGEMEIKMDQGGSECDLRWIEFEVRIMKMMKIIVKKKLYYYKENNKNNNFFYYFYYSYYYYY